jgi:prophage endopeptidase
MTRSEFIVFTALVLLVAFALGWLGAWSLQRFRRVSEEDIGEIDSLAQSLQEAEEMRDQAIAYLHHREAELSRELNETRAELAAAMDGLREARNYAETLHNQIHGQR